MSGLEAASRDADQDSSEANVSDSSKQEPAVAPAAQLTEEDAQKYWTHLYNNALESAIASQMIKPDAKWIDTPAEHKIYIVERWLQRPARPQISNEDPIPVSHVEGQFEYNIWYGRYLTDRHSRPDIHDREAAMYKCDPEKDCGYTRADIKAPNGYKETFFCSYFARGCCRQGAECTYRHTIPTCHDLPTIDWSRDVFGRERFGSHKDDMAGVGSFNHECKTVYVAGLKIDYSVADGLKQLENFLWKEFGQWGDLESVRVIPKKNIAFITFRYRIQAEFAKIAMADQPIGDNGSLLLVKWAYGEDSNHNNNHNNNNKRKLNSAVESAKANMPPPSANQEAIPVSNAIMYEAYVEAWRRYWGEYSAVTAAAGGATAEGMLPVAASTTATNVADSVSAESDENVSNKVRRLEEILANIDDSHVS